MLRHFCLSCNNGKSHLNIKETFNKILFYSKNLKFLWAYSQ